MPSIFCSTTCLVFCRLFGFCEVPEVLTTSQRVSSPACRAKMSKRDLRQWLNCSASNAGTVAGFLIFRIGGQFANARHGAEWP